MMSTFDQLRLQLTLASQAFRQEAENTAVLLKQVPSPATAQDQERILSQLCAERQALEHYKHTRTLYRQAAMEKIVRKTRSRALAKLVN
jgi:hypothetical protein